jgi:hypothetical protein
MIPALLVVAVLWLFTPPWVAWLALFAAVWAVSALVREPDGGRR